MNTKAATDNKANARAAGSLLLGGTASALVASLLVNPFPLSTWLVAFGLVALNTLATRTLNTLALGRSVNQFFAITLLGGGFRLAVIVIGMILAIGLGLPHPFEMILIGLTAHTISMVFEIQTLYSRTQRSI